jgi:hypothetical protein
VVLSDAQRGRLVLFGTPTGERETYTFFKIDSVNSAKTKVYFVRDNGVRDSIGGLHASLVDSLLRYGDSLVADYILPGGLIDARAPNGSRPVFVNNTLVNVGAERQSYWPLTTGSSPSGAPMLDDLDSDGRPDLAVVSQGGWVYRWQLVNAGALSSFAWPMLGGNAGRSFAYLGPALGPGAQPTPALQLFSYPNPAEGVSSVQFRFRFGGPAQNVRLDIFTYTGNHVLTWTPDNPAAFTLNWQGDNELPQPLPLRNFGPGVYRCRMEATVSGKKQVAVWKMAVVK